MNIHQLKGLVPALVTLTFIALGGCADIEDTEQNILPVTDAQAIADREGLQVGLVFSPEDGVTDLRFFQAAKTNLNALEVLQQSQAFALTLLDDPQFGTAICAINGVGQPANSCFGDAQGRYWSFSFRNLGQDWQEAMVGVESYIVKDGDVLALYWTGSNPDFSAVRGPQDDLSLADFASFLQ